MSRHGWHCQTLTQHDPHDMDGDLYYGKAGYVCNGKETSRFEFVGMSERVTRLDSIETICALTETAAASTETAVPEWVVAIRFALDGHRPDEIVALLDRAATEAKVS